MLPDIRHPLDTTLKNRDEICIFCRRSWKFIYRLIQERGFPAVKDGKNWTSDMTLICRWQQEQIIKNIDPD